MTKRHELVTIAGMPTKPTTLAGQLEVLRDHISELGIAESARRCKLPKGTVHRFLNPLVQPIAQTVDTIAHGLGYVFTMKHPNAAAAQRTAVHTTRKHAKRQPSVTSKR